MNTLFAQLKMDAHDRLCEAIAWALYGLSKIHLAPQPCYSICVGGWTTCGYISVNNGFFRFPLHKLARDFDVDYDAMCKSQQGETA